MSDLLPIFNCQGGSRVRAIANGPPGCDSLFSAEASRKVDMAGIARITPTRPVAVPWQEGCVCQEAVSKTPDPD